MPFPRSTLNSLSLALTGICQHRSLSNLDWKKSIYLLLTIEPPQNSMNFISEDPGTHLPFPLLLTLGLFTVSSVDPKDNLIFSHSASVHAKCCWIHHLNTASCSLPPPDAKCIFLPNNYRGPVLTNCLPPFSHISTVSSMLQPRILHAPAIHAPCSSHASFMLQPCTLFVPRG